MKLIPFLIYCLLVNLNLFGQSNPDDLGRKVFRIFQNGSIDSLDTLFPTSDQLIEMADSMGFKQTEDKIKEFKKLLPQRRQLLKEHCKEILEEGRQLGIVWLNASISKIEHETNIISIPTDSNKGTKDYHQNSVNIFFSYKNQSYRIILGEVYKYRQLWKLGNKIEFTDKL